MDTEGFFPCSKGTRLWSYHSLLPSIKVKNVCLELYLHFPTHFCVVVLVKEWGNHRLIQFWAYELHCDWWFYWLPPGCWLHMDHNWFLPIPVRFHCIVSHHLVLSNLHNFYTVNKQKGVRLSLCILWRLMGGWECRCIALLVLNLGPAWRWAVKLHPDCFTPRKRTSAVH